MGAQLGSKKGFSDMNLTPLIDVVLVVLIIMMVNIPIEIQKMTVRLPSNVVVPPDPNVQQDQVVVAVYATNCTPQGDPKLNLAEKCDQKFALNRVEMTKDQLFDGMTRHLRGMDNKDVFIDADPKVDYGTVVAMMDLARQAGAAKVGLAKMKPEGPQPATGFSPGTMPKGVGVGNPICFGACPGASAIDALIQPKLGAFMGCYDQGLASKPDLNGRIVVAVTFNPDGAQPKDYPPHLGSATVEDQGVKDCVLDVVKDLHSAPLPLTPDGKQGTAIMQFPLLFSPG